MAQRNVNFGSYSDRGSLCRGKPVKYAIITGEPLPVT